MDYKTAGVDIDKGDLASKFAYQNAKKTFFTRKNKIGQPVTLEEGFSGVLDFGNFFLLQNDDGVGTKSEIAEKCQKFDTLGQDLVAMVADDAVCVGAETVSITNTFDVPKVDPEIIKKCTESLSLSCIAEKIVVPGGEIAELGDAVNKMIWNATAVAVVKKEKFITGQKISVNDDIIGLKGNVLRSNGITLARKICEKNFGNDWHKKIWKDNTTWGEILLTPSKIFHRLLLDNILGDFEQKSFFEIKGIVHITGGGIPGNIFRIVPPNLGVNFFDLHSPHDAVKNLKKLGNIDDEECYRTWHCGTAMMLICDPKFSDKICQKLNKADSTIEAKKVGKITDEKKIEMQSQFSEKILII